MGSGNSNQNFIATVAVKIDEASLQAAGQVIKRTLEDATRNIDIQAFKQLAEAAKLLAGDLGKAAINAEKLAAQQAKTAEAEEKAATAKVKTQTAAERLEQTQRRSAEQSERSARAETLAYEKQLSATAQLNQFESARLAAERELAGALEAQRAVLEEQARLSQQIQSAVARPVSIPVNPNFNLGNLAGALGGNFFSTLLSGGSLNSAIGQSLGQLQPALFQIAQGGQQATAAFNALGIQGVGAVSGLTTGMAALGTAALAVVPVIGAIKDGIVGAYESQKDFVFQSGILAKQLGTTAEEGAKLRSLLTLVKQEDNIFAAITLNQIQASVAALDRVNRGLEEASPQVEKFGQALKQLGVSYQNNNGSLKTFAELTVDISAGLQKLDTAQRSLAIQNLAGLFGSDVAKIFGFGPDGLNTVLRSAVVVTNEQARANDALQVSLVGVTNAQTQFNISLANGITPLETWFNQFKTGALEEASESMDKLARRIGLVNTELANGEQVGQLFARAVQNVSIGQGGEALFNVFFPDENTLKARANELKNQIADLQRNLSVLEPGTNQFNEALLILQFYRKELEEVNVLLERINENRIGGIDKTRGGVFDPGAPTNAILIKQYKELAASLKDVEQAEKEVAKATEAITKNNLEVAKSFDAQINALQKAAGAYDKYYQSVGDITAKITAIQAKEGRPFTQIGTGTVKDVEKAIVDLRVLEERLAKLDEKQDPGSPRFDQLALNIRRRREALGLQPGELTDIQNVDITVGISGLSRKDREELNELFQKLAELKKEFLQGGFDVTQSVFGVLAQGLGNLTQGDFLKFLSGGAATLQDYAEKLGLFATPGFAQAIGETALQAKLLAGGFGDINTAAGASAAFEKYVAAFSDLRKELFDLSQYIADPKLLKLDTIFQDLENYKNNPQEFEIPIAIKLGLISEGAVSFLANTDSQAAISNRLTQALLGEDGEGGVASQVELARAQAQQRGVDISREKLANLGTSQGIVQTVLAQYGLQPGEGITAALDFSIDLTVNDKLVQDQAKAQKKLLDELQESKTINAKWNLNIDLSSNIQDILRYIEQVLAALGLPGGTVPGQGGGGTPGDSGGGGGGPRPVQNAAGGNVFRGQPYLVGEEGKPEFFVPRSDGRIIPGNETASILRAFGSNERLPSASNIVYAPVSNQYLSVDARGTNARDVTQAIQRTQRKGSLFTSSSDLIRGRDFLRARGL